VIKINDVTYYTTKDICEKFGVTNETVRRWRNNGIIKFNKISPKKFIYDENDIIKMLRGICI